MVSHHYFGYFAKSSKQTNETKGVDNLYLERTQVHFLVFEKCTYFQILVLFAFLFSIKQIFNIAGFVFNEEKESEISQECNVTCWHLMT